jgi:8-oxo-dGTP diphosphatase
MLSVTCAVIRNEENEVLVVQRGEKTDHPLKWEFPGGKLTPGESDEDCIVREIKEELSLEIIICKRLAPVLHDYGNKQITLIPFICDTLDEVPVLSEHIDYKWISPEHLISLDFSEADIVVARQYLDCVNKLAVKEEKITETYQPLSDDEELKRMINSMINIKEVDWIAISAIENSAIFRKLLDYSFGTDKKLAFRASWTLTKICDKSPEMIYPWLTRIIEELARIDNEGVQRSFLRILSFADLQQIDPGDQGILADYCFNTLNSGYSAIAVKAYSMEILYRLATLYPELVNELAASISILRGEGSAGIIARGTIILKKLAEISSNRGSSQK